jgi:hypothetical protein
MVRATLLRPWTSFLVSSLEKLQAAVYNNYADSISAVFDRGTSGMDCSIFACLRHTISSLGSRPVDSLASQIPNKFKF